MSLQCDGIARWEVIRDHGLQFPNTSPGLGVLAFVMEAKGQVCILPPCHVRIHSKRSWAVPAPPQSLLATHCIGNPLPGLHSPHRLREPKPPGWASSALLPLAGSRRAAYPGSRLSLGLKAF